MPKSSHPDTSAFQALSLVSQADLEHALNETAMVVVLDPDGLILEVNDMACGLSGYSREEVIGKPLSITYALPDADALYEVMLKELRQGRVWRHEVKQKTRSGEIFWVSKTVTPVLDENGKPLRYIAICHDVTDRKHTQEEITAIKTALDQSAMVVSADNDGNILTVNDKMCERSGYTREELLCGNVGNMFSPAQSREFIEDIWHTIRSGKLWKGEIELLTKSGEPYWIATSIVPFFDITGKPYRYISIRHDITDRKRMEKELQKRNAELNDMKFALETANMIVVCDTNKDILYVNEAFSRRMQIPQEEMLGKHVSIYMAPEYIANGLQETIDIIGSGKVWQGEIPHIAKDGSRFWTDTTIVPFLDADGKPYQYISIRHDITDRILYEEELRKRNAELVDLKFALETADMIVVSDADRNILYANESFCQRLQYTLEEIKGKHVGVYLSPNLSEEVLAEVHTATENGNAWKGEIPHVAKDGSQFWTDTTIVPFLDDNGKPFQFISIRHDITDRKLYEEELRKRNIELANFKHALDRSAMVTILDSDKNVVYANQKFCDRLGVQAEELIGQPGSTYISPGIAPEVVADVLDKLDRGDIWQGEIPHVTKDGTEFWTRTTTVPLLDVDGRPFQFISIRHDITDRKLYEEELRKRNLELADLKLALDEATLVLTVDKNGQIIYVNDQFCNISKYKREELIGQDISIMASGHHPPKFYEDLWAHIRSGKIWRGEIEHQTKNGSTYWVDTTIVPFLDETGVPFQYISIRQDITERRRVEEELRLLNEQLEERVHERTERLTQTNRELQHALEELKESEDLKETFISALTHDLRTPLIAQQRVLDIFIRYQEKLPAEFKPMSEGLLKSNHDVLDLVNKLLEIYHYESGEIVPEYEPINLHALFHDCSEDVVALATTHNIAIINQIPADFPTLHADSQLLKRVCTNLIGNALANIPAGGKITISASDTNYATLIEIADNGPGIPEDLMPHLFDRFFYARRKHKKLGSGLGLNICKMIMEMHGGSIAVESQSGQGTSFLLTFPKRS